jgi:hypothetical protein
MIPYDLDTKCGALARLRSRPVSFCGCQPNRMQLKDMIRNGEHRRLLLENGAVTAYERQRHQKAAVTGARGMAAISGEAPARSHNKMIQIDKPIRTATLIAMTTRAIFPIISRAARL